MRIERYTDELLFPQMTELLELGQYGIPELGINFNVESGMEWRKDNYFFSVKMWGQPSAWEWYSPLNIRIKWDGRLPDNRWLVEFPHFEGRGRVLVDVVKETISQSLESEIKWLNTRIKSLLKGIQPQDSSVIVAVMEEFA